MRPAEACTSPTAADSGWLCNTAFENASSVLALLRLLPAGSSTGSSVTPGFWPIRSGLSLDLLPLVFDNLLLLVLLVPTVLPGRPVSTEIKENQKSLHETNKNSTCDSSMMWSTAIM